MNWWNTRMANKSESYKQTIVAVVLFSSSLLLSRISGFGSWHMGNQNQDEVFLAASEAVGANRDAQGRIYDSFLSKETRLRSATTIRITGANFNQVQSIKPLRIRAVGSGSRPLTAASCDVWQNSTRCWWFIQSLIFRYYVLLVVFLSLLLPSVSTPFVAPRPGFILLRLV